MTSPNGHFFRIVINMLVCFGFQLKLCSTRILMKSGSFSVSTHIPTGNMEEKCPTSKLLNWVKYSKLNRNQ